MLPKPNKKRAQFILIKTTRSLHWERRNETERDSSVVERERYLCRAILGVGKNLKSFDESWNGGSRNQGGELTT